MILVRRNRIRKVASWVSLLILAFTTQGAFAKSDETSPLDDLAWLATDVVLAVTTPTDGNFEVLESWKGNLLVGDEVIVPELRPGSDAIPIANYPKSFTVAMRGGVSAAIPRQPVGSRLILFLKSRCRQSEWLTTADGRPACVWEPLHPLLTMKDSAVWIDDGHLFHFMSFNPGPSFLFVFPGSLRTLQKAILDSDAVQDDVDLVLAKHGAERAELLKPYIHSSLRGAREIALEELGKSGPAAAPAIRAMLDDPAFSNERSQLIAAFVEAGGQTAGPDLTRRLEKEVAFWKARAPSLAQGWWGQDRSPHPPLQVHYSETLQLLVGLEKIQYSDALGTVIQLRDLWRSLPQLDDPSGINQMADECDKFVRQAQTPRS